MTHLVCLQVACLFVYRHVVHDVSGSHPASVGKYLFLQKTHRREEMGLTKPRYFFKFVCFVQLFQGGVIWWTSFCGGGLVARGFYSGFLATWSSLSLDSFSWTSQEHGPWCQARVSQGNSRRCSTLEILRNCHKIQGATEMLSWLVTSDIHQIGKFQPHTRET